MLVSELIKILSQQDPNSTVVMPDGMVVNTVQINQDYIYLSDYEDDVYEQLDFNSRQMEEETFFPDDYAAID